MSDKSAGPSVVIRSVGIGSSTVALGTATVFIAIAAGLSFAADDGAPRPPAAWALRGSIAADRALPTALRGKGRQVARSDLD